MIVCKLTSGFGNQLFQYACGYAMAKRAGVELVVDGLSYDERYERSMEIDKLNLTSKIVKMRSPKPIRMIARVMLMIGRTYFKEKKLFTYDPDIEDIGKNAYIHGFWQSEKYFHEYKDELLEQFTLQEIRDEVQFFINQMREDETVAIHIRRGDYIRVKGCIKMDYYRNAIAKIQEYKKISRFVFFSDDIEWVKKEFADLENAAFFDKPDNMSDIEEFFVMSSCKNQIIANSSFSWWAAYLNKNSEKIVVAPEVAVWKGDFYPEDYIVIPAKKVFD